jgi:hypothetical protein
MRARLVCAATHFRVCCSLQLTPPELISSYIWNIASGSVMDMILMICSK